MLLAGKEEPIPLQQGGVNTTVVWTLLLLFQQTI